VIFKKKRGAKTHKTSRTKKEKNRSAKGKGHRGLRLCYRTDKIQCKMRGGAKVFENRIQRRISREGGKKRGNRKEPQKWVDTSCNEQTGRDHGRSEREHMSKEAGATQEGSQRWTAEKLTIRQCSSEAPHLRAKREWRKKCNWREGNEVRGRRRHREEELLKRKKVAKRRGGEIWSGECGWGGGEDVRKYGRTEEGDQSVGRRKRGVWGEKKKKKR